jgi:hypothetical protein
MTQSPNLAEQHVTALRELAEGRFDPEEWLDWWQSNAADLEPACPRGWFLRVKPKTEGGGVNRTALISQTGACYVLDQLNIGYSKSDRYQVGWQHEFDDFREKEKTRAAARVKEYKPIIATLATPYPEFARFLASNASRIQSLRPGASSDEIAQLGRDLDISIPASYAQFLKCTREVIVDDTLQITSLHPFIHESRDGGLPTEGMLCIADFWLEADGDQALLALSDNTDDNPPVLYYAHEQRPPSVRQIADTFTGWIESLPAALAE